MLVPGQLIQVKINNQNKEHFQILGYEVQCGETIMVPPTELTRGCSVEVQVICDFCGELIIKPYSRYLSQHTYNLDCCKQCSTIKQKSIMLKKYGVENPFESEEIKDKIKETVLSKYGVEYFSQTDEHREKTKLTNLSKYGYEYPNQNPLIKAKAIKTFAENGTVPTSSQQIQIHNIVQKKYPEAQLNYPLAPFSLDVFVCIDGVKIDIEYDGSHWHQDPQKDIKRDKIIQSQEIKTIRIRSGRLVPNEQDLFDAIDCLVQTDRRFVEIILSDWKKEGREEECQEQLQVAL